eukprot:NODE_350_length_10400_cov_0.385205.p3 type:complete len:415 gc:universal NODE_350_length_10400_cov_0.385205:3695-2451(-)
MICKLYVSPLTPSPTWKYTGLYGRISVAETIQIKDMDGELLFEHQNVKMTQMSKLFYAFATMDFLMGLSFEVNEFPDELFKDTLGQLTKGKKKPKTKKIDKASISAPSGFQHVSHVGYAKGKGLDVNNVPPEWLDTFKKAGLTSEQLQDPKTAKFVMNFMQNHSSDGQPTDKKRAPPPPPSRRRPPEIPPPETSNRPIAVGPPELPPPKKINPSIPQSLPPKKVTEPLSPEPLSTKNVIRPAAPDLPPPNLPQRISNNTEPVNKKPDPPKKKSDLPPPKKVKPQEPLAPAPDIPALNLLTSEASKNAPGAPPPPPPFSPPVFTPPPKDDTPKVQKPKLGPAVAPNDDLLAAIRSGGVKTLKKVEAEEQPKKFTSSMAGGNDLAGALASALADRNKVLTTLDSDEEEDDEDEWSD